MNKKNYETIIEDTIKSIERHTMYPATKLYRQTQYLFAKLFQVLGFNLGRT
ncbi:MAG: hypothetical protein ACI8RD_003712 [Bacillariaceae sp.]|jgi:hypothetical protein